MQLLFFVDTQEQELVMKRKMDNEDTIIESHFSLRGRTKENLLATVNDYLAEIYDYYYGNQSTELTFE